MTEKTPNIQIIIMALILLVALASFGFGPGVLLRYTGQGGQTTSSPAAVGVLYGSLHNDYSRPDNSTISAEDNLILGRWAKDPVPNDPDTRENMTFYKDGTFSVTHYAIGDTSPAVVTQGTWEYGGNNSYSLSLNGEQIELIRNGTVLVKEGDQTTFHRIEA